MRKNTIYGGIFAALIITWTALGYGVYKNVQTYEAFAKRKSRLTGAAFFKGVKVDGRDMSSLSLADAEAQYATDYQAKLSERAITLKQGGKDYPLTNAQCGYAVNYAQILDQAYSVGRFGTFDERYVQILAVSKASAEFTTTAEYSTTQIGHTVARLSDQLNYPAKNAELRGFDFSKKVFDIASDVPGLKVDQDKTGAIAYAGVNAGSNSADMVTIAYPASVTRAQISAKVGLLGDATTATSADTARNTNIKLATNAIYGKTLLPGEVFSFNQTTGRRTTAKGYRPAGAIVNGVLVAEPGGGVCQVSTTLFNVCAKADLAIIERHSHSWPSTYVKIGLDAAVNWPDADLKIKNTSSMPIYIWSSFVNQTLTFEIYGEKLAGGRTIKLSSTVTSTTPPGADIVRRNQLTPKGEKIMLSPARTGYTAVTYREYYANGKLQKKTELFKSAYPARGAIYETS